MRWALALWLCTIGSAHAQEDALTRGRAAREAGDHAAALTAFTAAWDATPGPVARAEMAIEELALGAYALAEAHASEALAFADAPEIATRMPELVATRDSAAGHLGSLEVRAPAGCAITIDGAAAGTTPLPHLTRLPPGVHVVRATRAGYESADGEVEVAVGDVARVTLEPTWIDTRPILERDGNGDGQRIAGWIAIVTGSVALVIGSVALGVELDRDSFLRSDACTPASSLETRESHCPDAAGTRSTYTDVARALYVSAAVLGAAGIVLLLTAPSAPTGTSARCAPSAAPGIVCQLTF